VPFDGTKVMGPDWARHHRGAAAGAMRATVDIGAKSGDPVYNQGTDDTTQAYTSLYLGPARIVVQNQAYQRAEVAGEELTGQGYLVQVDADLSDGVTFRVGQRCKVTRCADDPLLVNQELWLVSIPMGSERFTRDLVASDNQTDIPV
jgi:hypothetical protein